MQNWDISKIHAIFFFYCVQIHSFFPSHSPHILLRATVCDLLCSEKWMTWTQYMQCVKGSRFCTLMLLMSSALQWNVMIDMSSGKFSSFLSTLSTLTATVLWESLMTLCWCLYDYYSYQYRSTGYWLHLQNDSVDSQLCVVVTKALEAAYKVQREVKNCNGKLI